LLWLCTQVEKFTLEDLESGNTVDGTAHIVIRKNSETKMKAGVVLNELCHKEKDYVVGHEIIKKCEKPKKDPCLVKECTIM
jgi:hypothetical protein